MQTRIRVYGILAVLATSLLVPAQGEGQSTAPRPRRVGREIVNWDFTPDGAFRKEANQIRASRRAALARRDLQFLNGPAGAAAVTGNYNLPVVLTEFADTIASGTMLDTAYFRRLMFATSMTPSDSLSYSLKTYYEEVSNTKITITGSVVGWVHTDKTEAFVGQGCNAIGVTSPCSFSLGSRLGAFFTATLDSLNGKVDWSQFDKDGNGVVDFVTFIHPSKGGECGASNNDIWAHRYNMQSLRGSMYTTTTPRPGFPGQFMRINDYTVQGGFDCTSPRRMKVGTIAHETGHAFGIPDLYATAGNSEGIGEWGLMGSGNYTRPHSPAGWDAWSLVDVGWIKVDTLNASENVSLNPMQTSDTVLLVPLTGTDEYLLLENRARLQGDTAQMDPSRPTIGAGGQRKQPGLLVWHIDQSIVDAGRLSNSVNAGPIEGVRLVQADGGDDLHAGNNRGDIGDSYPGNTNNRRLNYHSLPASTRNDGGVAGFVIDSITQVSDVGAVTFRFRRSAPFRVTSTAVASGGQVTVNGVSGATYEEIFGLGDSVTISVADTQLVNSGRSQLVFSSWSDAGARQHTIVSDGTPDTLTATLAAKHRLNYAANGTGNVGTSGPLNNDFVTAGTPVTLTATPTGAGTFTNWTGDTTTANATLILPMGRPYNVSANFGDAVAVSYDEATNAILGITPLSGAQATYLDSQGNNNAVYDLGDYLAYLKANGLVTAPAVMARIYRRNSIIPR
jgi:M6 family metalloprotease-like protein